MEEGSLTAPFFFLERNFLVSGVVTDRMSYVAGGRDALERRRGEEEHFATLLLRSWPTMNFLSAGAPHVARPSCSPRAARQRAKSLVSDSHCFDVKKRSLVQEFDHPLTGGDVRQVAITRTHELAHVRGIARARYHAGDLGPGQDELEQQFRPAAVALLTGPAG